MPGSHDGLLVDFDAVFFCDAGLVGCKADGGVVLEPVVSTRLGGQAPSVGVEVEDRYVDCLK